MAKPKIGERKSWYAVWGYLLLWNLVIGVVLSVGVGLVPKLAEAVIGLMLWGVLQGPAIWWLLREKSIAL